MRDDFPEEVKRTLANRVANACSNPDCRAPTSGPQSDSTKALNIGIASHITSASPGGPRFNPLLTREQRCHADNGVWLCQNCAKLIDNDVARFSEALLKAWKTVAEDRARNAIGKTTTRTEAMVDHGKPHFVLEVVEEIHSYTPSGYFFWITNCGERSARNVTFDPIHSKRSIHFINLDPQALLAPLKRTPLTFHCGGEDEPFGVLPGNSGRLVLFCDDNPEKEPKIFLDVAIRCLDGDRQLEEHHTLEVTVAPTGARLKIYPTIPVAA